MTLPGVALVDDMDTVCKTHADITVCKVTFHQIHLHYNVWGGNLLPRKTFERSLRYLFVSSGTRIDRVITHTRENFEEK